VLEFFKVRKGIAIMTGLEERLADFIAKLRLEAERAGQQEPAHSHQGALVREAMAKCHGRIADDLQGFLQSTLQRNHATPATVRGMRDDLQSLTTKVSILQQHLKKLEAAPVSVRGALFSEGVVDSLNTKIQALERELATVCRDLDAGLATFGRQET
jgi:hypothetical protein